jgi:pectate lyase
MRELRIVLVATCLLAATVAGVTATAAKKTDLGRETLAPNDGWASFSTGTTGGSNAAADQIYTVRDRQELIAALNNGIYPPPSSNPSNVPKIIYVDGTIDANVDDANQPLACDDYARNGYTLEAYLATYDPAVWGRRLPSGPLEQARVASQQAQQARVRIRVGSNTTIVGVGKKAVIRGAWLDIRGTAGVANSRTNIIIRNITFQDTFDCFPQWDPTDGSLGNWNSQYDSISLRDSDHVWIDHNSFEDKETADSGLPTFFGRLFQVHDGQVDITNASDLVTVSYNRFTDHDKVMLIGSSDSATADRGKLRVTLHHNLFEGLGQRAPRVRFGQVHVFNNYYKLRGAVDYQYSWGVGRESAIYAQNNFFRTDHDITPDRFISRLNGTAINASGTLVDAASDNHLVDVVGAYNAENNPDLLTDVGWQPVLFIEIEPAFKVPSAIESRAGPFNW